MSSASRPIVVVGSINIDLVAGAHRIPAPGETVQGHDFQVHPGGKGANQAVAVARLGYPVSLIGRLGDDAFGAQLRQHLTAAGVEMSAVMTSAGPSGVAAIVVAESGENAIVVVPGANALLSRQDLDAHLPLIRSASMVLTQLETPLETVSHLASLCAQQGIPLMLDPAPARILPRQLIENVTWFTPNESEAAFFADSVSGDAAAVARALLRQGAQNILLKLGARGAYLATNNNLSAAITPFCVQAVDTTAAGDCFNGAFATALCMGNDAASSARYAAAAAAIAVTRQGAQPSMPTTEEVRSMLDCLSVP